MKQRLCEVCEPRWKHHLRPENGDHDRSRSCEESDERARRFDRSRHQIRRLGRHRTDPPDEEEHEQAAKSAQSYLDMMGFSRSGLIEQLVFEGYTQDQATYGADQAGL